MNFYVSGPVVESLEGKSQIHAIYRLIQQYLKGHEVELPVRTKELSGLSPQDFYKIVFEKIQSSDAVFAVLADNDQSGPVETTIASYLHKPLSLIETTQSAPRLIRGLPNVVDATALKPAELEDQLETAVQRLIRNLRRTRSRQH